MPRPGRNGREAMQVRSTRRNAPGAVDAALQVWVAIGPNTYQLWLHDEGAIVEGPNGPRPLSLETGPNVHLMIPHKKMVIDLSFMSHEEHVAFRTFINMALDLAEPIVLLRDKEAQDAFDAGDDSFHRLHRPVPNLVVRPRAKRAHSEVVRLGLDNVVARGWDFLREYLGTGRRRDEVADRSEGESGAADNPAQAHKPEDVL